MQFVYRHATKKYIPDLNHLLITNKKTNYGFLVPLYNITYKLVFCIAKTINWEPLDKT